MHQRNGIEKAKIEIRITPETNPYKAKKEEQ
jgi:hypothetical protein